MSNKTYDMIKLIALLIIPICAFITSVGNTLGYDVSVIVAILTAVDTLLGALVKILSDQYHKGEITDEADH